jgi:dolichyl-diphosphooligosaccharide--protein glycosyltransferase
MMEESFLYKLHSHRLVEGVEADIKKFEEVYRSKYGKVRIFKLLGVDEGSKSWVADPRNHVCDVPGSWFCRGQYPPALTEVLQTKQDFSQLEDFNRRQVDSEYQEQYFENLNNPKRAPKRPIHIEEPKTVPRSININLNPSKAEIAAVNSIWEDTEETTELWKLITSGEVNDLKDALQINPLLGHIRSSDGRGPMFWAFENRRQDMVKVLMKNGVSHSERDKEGLTPVDLLDAAR